MNIWGYKKKIKETNEKLKQGKRYLGIGRFENLEKRIRCWRHCIEKLRELKKKKEK